MEANKKANDDMNYGNIQDLPIGFFVLQFKDEGSQRDLYVHYCNAEGLKLYGLNDGDIIGKKLMDISDKEIAYHLYRFEDVALNGQRDTFELAIGNEDRRYYSIYMYSPKVGFCACFVYDVTAFKGSEFKDIELLEHKIRKLEGLDLGEQSAGNILPEQEEYSVFEYDKLKDSLTFFGGGENYHFEQHFARGGETLMVVHPNDIVKFEQYFIDKIMECQRFIECQTRFMNTSKDYIWARVTMCCEYDENADFVKGIGVIRDINDELEYIKALKFAAEFDDVTGLYNKKSFLHQAELMFMRGGSKEYAIIRFDIDRFKMVNEIFGYQSGDDLLRFIAAKIKLLTLDFEEKVYARYQADVFHICVSNEKEKLEELTAALDNITLDYHINFDLVPSIGIYIVDNFNVPITVMCDRAKIALNTIKGNYLKRHAYYSESMHDDILREQEIVNIMKHAMEHDEFEVYLQPKVRLTDSTISGAEALVRWHHFQKGFIMPSDFIPLFEQNGFIMMLDEYVFEQVCKFQSNQLANGKIPLPISVNISKISVYNPNLCETIIGLMNKYNLSPKYVEIEITETAYSENEEQLIGFMEKLQMFGFKILMDDFGRGYSSLNMLKNLPVDILKIDLGFLLGEDKYGRSGNILSSVVRMAKWLKIPVIAEGVESQGQVDFLKSVGCLEGQGYLYSKPIKMNEFLEMVEQNSSVKRHIEPDVVINALDEVWSQSELMSVVFNNISSAIGVYELNNRRLEPLRLNDKYFEMIKISSEEFFDNNLDVMNKIHDDDKEKIYDLFSRAFKSGEQCEQAYRRIIGDGSIIWLMARAKFVAGSETCGIYFVTLEDITGYKEKEMQLAELNHHVETIVESMDISILRIRIDDAFRIVYANDCFYTLYGLSEVEFYDKFNPSDALMMYSFMHEDDVNMVRNSCSEAVAKRLAKIKLQYRLKLNNGQVKHVESGFRFEYFENFILVTISCSDVTKFREVENKLLISEKKLKDTNEKITNMYEFERQYKRMLLENSKAFYEIDLTDNIIIRGDELKLKGLGLKIGDSFDDLIMRTSRYVIHDTDSEMFLRRISCKRLLSAFAAGDKEVTIEYQMMTSDDGEYIWVEAKFALYVSKNNEHVICTWTAFDIDARKNYELSLKFKSERDTMTGLYDKVSFEKIVSKALKRAGTGAFFMVDVDNFKQVNDRFGHACGDRVIKTIAKYLTEIFEVDAVIGRMGGDEFAVFISSFTDKNMLTFLADKICSKVNRIKLRESEGNVISCSVGVAYSEECADIDFQTLYDHADTAQYGAKHSGKNGYVITAV